MERRYYSVELFQDDDDDWTAYLVEQSDIEAVEATPQEALIALAATWNRLLARQPAQR